jgi:hypothetical protein
MADTAKLIYEGQPGTTDTLLYTAPTLAGIVRGIHIVNTTAAAATITLGMNAAAALAIANHFLSVKTIGPNDTYDWSGFLVISGGGTIRALQGTAAALTVVISGVEQ